MTARRPPPGAVIPRPWSRRERRVVLNGFAGRLCIALEPVLCTAVFGALTVGMLVVHTDPARPGVRNMVVLAPVFALGAAASLAYAIALMVGPLRALAHTFRPIYTVDGYVRYRPFDAGSPDGSNGYVAVLDDRRVVAGEWPSFGALPLPSQTLPALCEFSVYGGIHRIDGAHTGALPETLPPLGVGCWPRRAPIGV